MKTGPKVVACGLVMGLVKKLGVIPLLLYGLKGIKQKTEVYNTPCLNVGDFTLGHPDFHRIFFFFS